MRKLHNVAYEIYVKEHGAGSSPDYSKFEDVVYNIDQLGKDLLLSPMLAQGDKDRLLMINIKSVVDALVELSNSRGIQIDSVLTEILEKCLEKSRV